MKASDHTRRPMTLGRAMGLGLLVLCGLLALVAGAFVVVIAYTLDPRIVVAGLVALLLVRWFASAWKDM